MDNSPEIRVFPRVESPWFWRFLWIVSLLIIALTTYLAQMIWPIHIALVVAVVLTLTLIYFFVLPREYTISPQSLFIRSGMLETAVPLHRIVQIDGGRAGKSIVVLTLVRGRMKIAPRNPAEFAIELTERVEDTRIRHI